MSCRKDSRDVPSWPAGRPDQYGAEGEGGVTTKDFYGYFDGYSELFSPINCRDLSELALLYQRIGNDALFEVSRGCKLLQALHLVDCSSIGDDAICNIARGCGNLKKLHVRRCYEVACLVFFSFVHCLYVFRYIIFL
ncbi:hypothetical protein HHK36_012551 [Tetracentron sinense]|uniref:Uncharacterized protein n=1 Tax=Tetracentron sinense TaxID=13715 RepID=A0A834Z9I6_TETSI|nr:hypothetical protein HHK36_012551 [Tetracentron sinense]